MTSRQGPRLRGLLVLGLLALVGLVLGLVLGLPGDPAPSDRPLEGTWVTSPTDAGRRLLRVGAAPPGGDTVTVSVDPGDRRQVWRGTGAAMTDASQRLLGSAPEASRMLYDPDRADGARLSWVRLPLTATDLSPTPWTWGWDGDAATPSPEAQAAVSQVLDLVRLQPDLRVVATAWTAPEWMKDPRGVRGGALRDDELGQYAAMLVAQADALREAGVPLAAMTLGNEPGYGADYPSMTMTDRQLAELGTRVGPQLDRRDVALWAVDHNWADRPRYDAVLAAAPGVFDAAAFHCYSGDPEQMSGLPVPPVVTECTGTTGSWEESFAWQSRRLVADSTGAGSTGLMLWNLALDASGGPGDTSSAQGCRTCRGLVQVEGDRVQPGPEYYVLAHLSRAADPGARVLGSRVSRAPAGADVAAAAFANPDGTIGVVAHNDTGTDRVLVVRVPGHADVRRPVRAGELVTVRFADGPDRPRQDALSVGAGAH